MLIRISPTDSSVSKVKNSQSLITGAAYLLFYRRRSSVPLGGPRFAEICERFDRSLEDDGSGSGEDQEVGGSSLYGSSTAGRNGAGAARLRGGGRGSDSGPYGGVAEDEGIEMGESSNTTAASAYKTGWSFGGLDGSGGAAAGGGDDDDDDDGRTALVDYASDDAQHDSGSEGRSSLMDADFPVPGGAGPFADGEAAGGDDDGGAWGEGGGKRAEGEGQDEDAVAEIRLEDESKV